MIVEPVAANMGVVPPAAGFLESLRKITQREGALLIFDEVITGFRLRYGGAQDEFSVKPDLTTLGKIIGGGLPVAAYGGRRDVMDMIAPLGPVYQAGTLSGNPLAMRAGLTTLPLLEGREFYSGLSKKAERLAENQRAPLTSIARSMPSVRCSRCSSRKNRFETMARPRNRTRSASRLFFVKCWTAACCCLLRSSRHSSSHPPIRTPILIALSRQRGRVCARFGKRRGLRLFIPVGRKELQSRHGFRRASAGIGS